MATDGDREKQAKAPRSRRLPGKSISRLYSEWWQFGAAEEIRTPDP
jgi:hypothetical protein